MDQLAQQNAQLMQQMHLQSEQVNLLSATVQTLQQQQQPRSASKVKPRKPNDFTGKSKELPGWLYEMSLYCHNNGIADDKLMVQTAFQYLQGNAKTWLQKVCPADHWDDFDTAESVPFSTWKELGKALHNAFGPLEEHLQARERLEYLKQRRTEAVEDYVKNYRQLMLELPGLNEEEWVYRFQKGLYWDKVREYITQATAGKDPNTLLFEEVASLATRGETTLVKATQRGKAISTAPQWYSRPSTPLPRAVPMDIGNVNFREPMDRDTLFKQGRCFYCKERGHRRPDCPVLKRQGNGQRRQ